MHTHNEVPHAVFRAGAHTSALDDCRGYDERVPTGGDLDRTGSGPFAEPVKVRTHADVMREFYPNLRWRSSLSQGVVTAKLEELKKHKEAIAALPKIKACERRPRPLWAPPRPPPRARPSASDMTDYSSWVPPMCQQKVYEEGAYDDEMGEEGAYEEGEEGGEGGEWAYEEGEEGGEGAYEEEEEGEEGEEGAYDDEMGEAVTRGQKRPCACLFD
jgi:hypothetical protein